MRRIFFITMMSLILLVGCGEKKENETEVVNNAEKKELYEEYTGVGGYIVKDNIFDYSDRFETVYEWCDGVKLPIEKFEGGKINLVTGTASYNDSQYALVEISDFLEEDFFKYIENMEKKGYTKAYIDSEGVDAYNMYKDNLLVSFIYANEKDNPVVVVYIISGNVKSDIDTKKIRDIINDSNILNGNEYFENYVILEIANKNVANKGYTEYLLISPTYYESHEDNHLPYYIIMKDNSIVFGKQGVMSVEYPSNANIIEGDDGSQKLVISGVEYSISSSEIQYIGCVKHYVLKDGKFVEDEMCTDIELINTLIMGIYEDESLKYYTLKENEKFDGKIGYRDKWVIDEEYIGEQSDIQKAE